MTFSDNNARNHKLTFMRMRAGMHAFLGTINTNNESIVQGLQPGLFAHNTEAGTGVLGSLYYLQSNNKYDLALDLGPTDRSNRYGLVYCVGNAGAGSAFDATFACQGGVRTSGAHGVTPGTYGYLSKTTPGLIVPNEGATSGFSDAFDTAKPVLVGTYLSGVLFAFHVPLLFE